MVEASIGDKIARWAAANPKIRRVWVLEAANGHPAGHPASAASRGSLEIALELQPVGDSEESLAVWVANGPRWQSQLRERIGPAVQLGWLDPDHTAGVAKESTSALRQLVYERVR